MEYKGYVIAAISIVDAFISTSTIPNPAFIEGNKTLFLYNIVEMILYNAFKRLPSIFLVKQLAKSQRKLYLTFFLRY